MKPRATGHALLLPLCLLFAAACGEGEGAPPESNAAAARNAEACGTRVVAHRHGETRIEGVPERVVSLSLRDQDAALALGVVPVAVRDGFYDEPYTRRPWVRGELGGAEPAVVPLEGMLNYERVAELRPDLILAAASGLSKRDYQILSRIAPTVAQSADHPDWGAPWQTVTETVGRALCRTSRAAEVVEAVEARLQATRRAHPELEGATAVVVSPGGPDGSYGVYGPQDSRMRFLASLGMEVSPRIAELAGDRWLISVSAERIDLLDEDVLVWIATPDQWAALESDPLYQRLEVAREERDLFVRSRGRITAAITNTSPLNIPYLLDELVPRIVSRLEKPSGRRAADG